MNQLEGPILIVKLADIGDAVLALPAIQALRSERPDARIDVLTTSAGANVFSRSPAVDNVIILAKQRFDRFQGLVSPGGLLELGRLIARLRRERYQSVVILHHLTTRFGTQKFRALAAATGAPVVAGLDNGRGGFLTHPATDYGFGIVPEWKYSLAVVQSLGLQPVDSRPHLAIPARARNDARRILDEAGVDGGYVVVHPEVGEYSPARAWPGRHFASLAEELLRERQLPVVLVGTQPDQPGLKTIAAIPGVIDLVGTTSFDELCALVSDASLVIGADSSVSHLAAAFDRPSISIFGPSNVHAWQPFGSRVQSVGQAPDTTARGVALHLNMPCSPCFYTGFRLGRPNGCRSRACLTGLLPNDVISTAYALLEHQGD